MGPTAVHCYKCFIFPSKDADFYISNCMHIFCGSCRKTCEADPEKPDAEKCLVCAKSIKFMKIGAGMPSALKGYFMPPQAELNSFRKKYARILDFQKRQRTNWHNYATKKLTDFEKLKAKFIEERNKKEQYKRALSFIQAKLQEKSIELAELKSVSNAEESTVSTKQSSYVTPNKPAAPRLNRLSASYAPQKEKSVQLDNPSATVRPVKLSQEDPYITPRMPAKSLSGIPNTYITPKNPSITNKIPHIERTKTSVNSNSSSSFIDTTSEMSAENRAMSGRKSSSKRSES